MVVEFEVIVCFDIRKNKTRNRFIKLLKREGLIRIQKSVFWGYITSAEKRSILREFPEILEEGDMAFLVEVPLSKFIKSQNFGYRNTEMFNRNYNAII